VALIRRHTSTHLIDEWDAPVASGGSRPPLPDDDALSTNRRSTSSRDIWYP
jgi:hypothetical protein